MTTARMPSTREGSQPSPSSEIAAAFSTQEGLRARNCPVLSATIAGWLAPGIPVDDGLVRGVVIAALKHADERNAAIRQDVEEDALREAVRGHLHLARDVDDLQDVDERPPSSFRALVRGKRPYAPHQLAQRGTWAWIRYQQRTGEWTRETTDSLEKVARERRLEMASRLTADLNEFLGDTAAVRRFLNDLVDRNRIRPDLRDEPDGLAALTSLVGDLRLGMDPTPEALPGVATFAGSDALTTRLLAGGINRASSHSFQETLNSLEMIAGEWSHLPDRVERHRAAVMDWLLRDLSESQQAVFGVLAVVPAVTLPLRLLVDEREGMGIRVDDIAVLVGLGLIEETEPERYRLVRALRPHAAQVVLPLVPDEERQTLTDDLAEYYTEHMEAAAIRLATDRLRDSATLRMQAGLDPGAVEGIDPEPVRAWFAQEIATVMEVAKHTSRPQQLRLALATKRAYLAQVTEDATQLAQTLASMRAEQEFAAAQARGLVRAFDEFVENAKSAAPTEVNEGHS